MKKLLILIILFVAGCYDSYDYSTPRTNIYYETSTRTTKVISIPPGARIELDGDYLGDAPLEIQWEVYSLRGLFTRNHTVKALPIHVGQYVQSKFFQGGYQYGSPDKVPKTILFDMNLGPIPKQYELDIR